MQARGYAGRIAIGPLELLILLLMLGLPVLIIVLVVRGNDSRPCPQCAKRVRKGRLDCPHCGYDFRVQPAA